MPRPNMHSRRLFPAKPHQRPSATAVDPRLTVLMEDSRSDASTPKAADAEVIMPVKPASAAPIAVRDDRTACQAGAGAGAAPAPAPAPSVVPLTPASGALSMSSPGRGRQSTAGSLDTVSFGMAVPLRSEMMATPSTSPASSLYCVEMREPSVPLVGLYRPSSLPVLSTERFEAMIAAYCKKPRTTITSAPYTYEDFKREFTQYAGADVKWSDADFSKLKALTQKHPDFFEAALQDQEFLDGVGRGLRERHEAESFLFPVTIYNLIDKFIKQAIEKLIEKLEASPAVTRGVAPN